MSNERAGQQHEPNPTGDEAGSAKATEEHGAPPVKAQNDVEGANGKDPVEENHGPGPAADPIVLPEQQKPAADDDALKLRPQEEDLPDSDEIKEGPVPTFLDKLRWLTRPAEGEKDKDALQIAEPAPGDGATPHADAEPMPDPKLGDAHPVYYTKITLSAEPAFRLDYIRSSGNNPPPPEYRAFRKQVDDVGRLVRVVFQDHTDQQQDFFHQLHGTAWSGLVGPNSNLDVGADNLQDVKDYIADQFPMVREKIWRSNRNVLLVVGGICLLASIAYYFVTGSLIPNTSAGTSIWPALQLAMFAIPLGVAFGLFVEFLFRVNDDVPYDQLRTINAGRWRPFQRAFNTLVVAYLLAGILALELLQIGIASVLLNDFVNKKPWLSLVIGFITGFAFPYVRDLIQQVKPEKRSDPMAGR